MSFTHWEKLLYGIEKGECTLFLGPELPMISPAGDRRFPARELAARLSKGLSGEGPVETDRLGGNLAWLAQRFVAQEDELALGYELEQWNEELKEEPSQLHDDLAALPFRIIVTTAHDPLMHSALRRVDKAPAIERYHFRGKNDLQLGEPTAEAPLLFHLYGHVAEPPSVVLTETQLLDFLARLIAGVPRLQDDLRAELTNGRLFLFLGFGLRQWHLRILLHVLKVLRQGSRSFAVETVEESAGQFLDEAVLFYRENFKMDVFQSDVGEFVRELRSRYAPPAAERPAAAQGPPASGKRVFICHASEDAKEARRIHEALEHARLEPWLDKKSLRGGEVWNDHIERTIKEVDFFVVLNSRSLEAKSRASHYVNKEINRALEAAEYRLQGSFIIPVRVDDTPLLEKLSRYHAIELGVGGPKAVAREIKRLIVAV